eukprot:TRINITY_DN6659_c0_g2_i2.p1 TRINITY_DN6659_c0_g2~~TRINITY_DN6659_c0_g2_i2.p1  ORF type:complete len:142 (+),score=11.62 TRINITY_DN6659_c0_g2_i2:58-483(+)
MDQYTNIPVQDVEVQDSGRSVMFIFVLVAVWYMVSMIIRLIKSKGREAGYDFPIQGPELFITTIEKTLDLYIPFLGAALLNAANGSCFTYCSIISYLYVLWVFLINGLDVSLGGVSDKVRGALLLTHYVIIFSLFVNFFLY